MPSSNSVYSCAFRACTSKTGHGITMFSFPTDPKQAELWAKACYRTDLLPMAKTLHKSGFRLCEHHFEEKLISIVGSSQKRAVHSSIPSIFIKNMVENRRKKKEKNSLVPKTKVSQKKPLTLKKKASEKNPPKASEKNPVVLNAKANEKNPPKASEKNPPEASEKNPPKASEKNPPEASEKNPPKASEKNPPEASEKNPPKVSEKNSVVLNAKATEEKKSIVVNATASDKIPKKIFILSDVTIVPGKNNNSTNMSPILFNNNKVTSTTSVPLSPSSSETQQTDLDLASNSPRKRKLETEIEDLPKHAKTEDACSEAEFKKMCDMFLDNPLNEIIKSHVTSKRQMPSCYSAEIIQFALILYFLSPRAYNLLCNLLTLPTKENLQQMTEQISCKPGLDNDAIFKALEFKTKLMLEQEKHCVLCIDEISLKSSLFYDTDRDELVGFEDKGNAKKNSSMCKSAVVIMARGLYSLWKQPLAFFFVGSQLKSKDLKLIIEECVLKLANIGLNVDAFSSGMGSNFEGVAKLYKVTPENPEFKVKNHKLLYIFDPCHLIKATRDNLMEHTFEFDGNKTSWKFIQSFYKQDSEQFYKCAPKLTDAHIYPFNCEKMQVKLAAQLLSHTVVRGMNTYMSLGAFPAEAFATIEVVERFNNLFDILNSDSLNNSDRYKNAFNGSGFQIIFFNDALQFLSDLKIINSDYKDVSDIVKFHKYWMITINSVRKLWDKLSKLDFKFLQTRSINTDCLEDFFEDIRKQCDNCANPTPIQFSKAFRKLYWQNYLHSENINCKNDLKEVLLDVKSTNISEIFQGLNMEKPIIAVLDTTERLPEQNTFTYVCEYLLKKALDVHSNCNYCKKYKKQYKTLDVNYLLIFFNTSNIITTNVDGALQNSPELFIKYIYDLENVFISNFEIVCLEQGISHKLLNLMENIEFNHPCPNYPKLYVLQLFIRLRIFYSVKNTNLDLMNEAEDVGKINISSLI